MRLPNGSKLTPHGGEPFFPSKATRPSFRPNAARLRREFEDGPTAVSCQTVVHQAPVGGGSVEIAGRIEDQIGIGLGAVVIQAEVVNDVLSPGAVAIRG